MAAVPSKWPSTAWAFPVRGKALPQGDPAALAAKIQEVMADPLRRETMSRRNLSTSLEFIEPVLAERRRNFYQHVHDSTKRWEER